MDKEKITEEKAIDELKFLIEMLTDHDKYGIDYYGIRTHSKYLTNEHCFSPQTQEHLVQALDIAIESLEQDQEESLVIKKVKGKSHWKNLVTGKYLEDYKAVVFDKAREQIYVISDVITLHSEPNIKLEPYERKEY